MAMATQINYAELWSAAFGLNEYRCPRCQSIIDSRFHICNLCLYQINTVPNAASIPLDCDWHQLKADTIIQTKNQPGETLQSSIKSSDQAEKSFARIIDRSADYIILGLDKLGDGIIYSFDKVASLPDLVGKITK